MKSLAIIGTGIAGMACGYHLQSHYALTIYEKNNYVGGHTHTVQVQERTHQVPIDTGFIVYNEANYPELTKLFAELGVATQPTTMSFSVQHALSGLEFSGSGWNGLFSQRKNVLSGTFWKLLMEINRFNQEAPKILEDERYVGMTLKAYAQEQHFSPEFLERYLIPMSSAVWSTLPKLMLNFPAVTLVRFFKNHHFLGLHGQHAWRTVTGGSWRYRDKLIAGFQKQIRTSQAAVSVEHVGEKAQVRDASGSIQEFDAVIMAAHADETLKMLASPTTLESQVLKPFAYQKNIAILHTDAAVMPKARRAWSAWNYWLGQNSRGEAAASTIYWMNALQNVSQNQNYFISINDPGRIRPELKIQEFIYDHPLFSADTLHAQKQLPSLNDRGPIYFCGSYFRYGFHEDALMSALDVVRRLR